MTKEEFIKQNIVALLFCLQFGAGYPYTWENIWEEDPVTFIKIEIELFKIEIEMETEEGKERGGPGDWVFELVKIVENQDRDKLIQLVKSIAQRL